MPSSEIDGATYDPEVDRDRLVSLGLRVRALVADGAWRTLNAIQRITGGSEASISARLRDLRKERYGGHIVERRRVGNGGLFEYRVLPPPPSGQTTLDF